MHFLLVSCIFVQAKGRQHYLMDFKRFFNLTTFRNTFNAKSIGKLHFF